jgi:hypothetical protein
MKCKRSPYNYWMMAASPRFTYLEKAAALTTTDSSSSSSSEPHADGIRRNKTIPAKDMMPQITPL